MRDNFWKSMAGLAAGFAAALLIAVLGGLVFMLNYKSSRLSEMHFVAEPQGAWSIGRSLQKADIISSAFLFRLGVFFIPGRGLRGGEYRIKPDDSIADIIAIMRRGKAVGYKFTIPEGFTHHQIKEALRISALLDGHIDTLPEEGLLLPETYFIYRGQKRSSVIKKMHWAHKKLVKRLWQQREASLPLDNPMQAVVLASIVEKETGLSEERPRIAGVFINRLSRDSYMQLQSDPTVIYALMKGKPLERSLTYKDLRLDNPYNTYINYGLPPGAIANPGRAAIEAVLNPAKTKDLFFVADGTGGHSFAITYDEHLQNVAKWRQVQNGAQNGGSANEAANDAVMDNSAASQ